MRAVIVFVVGLPLLLGLAIPTRAQDGPPPVETVVGYYEDENPRNLGVMLYRWNVCFERFVKLNPDIEILNIPYGMRVILPKKEPCYKPKVEFLPTNGQVRLKYFERGAWLMEPYYTDKIVYKNYNSIEEIMYDFNVCRDALLDENYSLIQYGEQFLQLQWTPSNIFIPTNDEQCDADLDSSWIPPSWLRVEMRYAEFSPLLLTQDYNICPEILPGFWRPLYGANIRDDDVFTFTLWDGHPPCYNDEGKRLTYFDLSGHQLDQPEYIDLEVYRVQPDETLPDIAKRFDVCLNDLISLNNFPQLPINVGEIEIFIPYRRPCPNGIRAQLVGTHEDGFPTTLIGVSLALDICVEDLSPLNPHLYPLFGNRTIARAYQNQGTPIWVLVPETTTPCYRTYETQRGDSIFDIERKLNICYEAIVGRPQGRIIDNDLTVLYMQRNTPPCYNDQGQRLRYEAVFGHISSVFFTLGYDPSWMRSLTYSERPVHVFGRADTVYSISRQYNVCVHELLAANLVLEEALPEGFPTFIPVTRPCYDEATGMPLIYEDENGVPLDEPRVGDKLIYYGTEPFGHVSHYYNVCENRIRDANAAKLAGEAHYLGWIIPHDRPPCYDENGYPIDYAVKQHEDSGGIVHTVQVGDTLSGIAARYDKSIYWIAAANKLSSLNNIWIDQNLIIPGGVTKTDASTISAALLGLAAVAGVWLWRRR